MAKGVKRSSNFKPHFKLPGKQAVAGEASASASSSDGEEVKNSNKRNATSTGRKKVPIEYLNDPTRRAVTFTKRKAGLMKKAYEFATLTGAHCLVILVSDTGVIYNYATDRFKPFVEGETGKRTVQRAINRVTPIFPAGDFTGPDQANARSKVEPWIPEEEDEMMEEEAPPGESDYLFDIAGTVSVVGPSPRRGARTRRKGVMPENETRVNGFGNGVGTSKALPGMSVAGGPLPLLGAFQSPLEMVESEISTTNYGVSNLTQLLSASSSLPISSLHSASLTPYQRASKEHSIAFENYRKSFSLSTQPPTPSIFLSDRFHASATPSPNDFGSSSRWGSPMIAAAERERESVRTNLDAETDEFGLSVPLVVNDHAQAALADRRSGWNRAEEFYLEEAKRNPTIFVLIQGYTSKIRAQLSLPPSVPTPLSVTTSLLLASSESTLPRFPLAGIELTLSDLEREIRNNDVECAIRKVLQDIPSRYPTDPVKVAEATRDFVAFLDYAERYGGRTSGGGSSFI